MILAFALVFFMSFVAFMLAYRVGFGDRFMELSTVWKSFFFLSRSFVGSVSIADVYQSAPVLGFALIVLFVIVICFIVMNVFAATMITALANAHERQQAMVSVGGSSWDRLKQKFKDAKEEAYKEWDVARTTRKYCPGLYARQKKKKQAEEARQKMRDLNSAKQKEIEADMQRSGAGGGRLPIAG